MARSGIDRRTVATVLLVLSLAFSAIVSAALAVPPSDRGQPESSPANVSHPAGGEKSPAKRCKAERAAMGAQEFAQKYGTNANKRNAFGKCVSGKAKEKRPEPR
jgi:hypothetical protein